MKTLQNRIKSATESLVDIKELNDFLALPQEYQNLVYGKRKPIHEHFGEAIFPIPNNFDTGSEEITFLRLAKALIEPDGLKHDLRRFYTFLPVSQGRPDSSPYDIDLVHDTLIRFMFYDFACLNNFKMPYKRLMIEVGKKTPGAFFKLIQVDKSFMASPYGSSLIIKKQHQADWKFFEKLAEAIKRKPIDEPLYLFKAKLICAYFWDTEFEKFSYREIIEALENAGILMKGLVDPRSFSKMLNRLGLKKTRHTRN